jgi:hypothetical protein
MRVTVLVTIVCAATTVAARPDWHGRIRWHASEEPRKLDPAAAPAARYETAELRAVQRLVDGGWYESAMARLSRVILESSDLREVCRARILATRVALDYGSVAERPAAAFALVSRLRVRRSDDDCRREGDALVGELATVVELESQELDPIVVASLWDAAAAIATSNPRRTAAIHNGALDYWRRASWGDGGAARWRAAAIAAEQAAAADPTDDDMIGRARDARWNASLFATNGR